MRSIPGLAGVARYRKEANVAEWRIETFGRPIVTISAQVIGRIDYADAADAAQRVSALLERNHQPIELRFDLRELEGYPVEVREMWSEVLKANKARITQLTWISSQSLHRMVARAVGLFTGIPSKLLDDLPDQRFAR